jgi:hypothetical protein
MRGIINYNLILKLEKKLHIAHRTLHEYINHIKFYYQKNHNFNFNSYKLKHLKYFEMCSLIINALLVGLIVRISDIVSVIHIKFFNLIFFSSVYT